jgi:dTDP-4-amino-4,6-dideoxygalactose transaminase
LREGAKACVGGFGSEPPPKAILNIGPDRFNLEAVGLLRSHAEIMQTFLPFALPEIGQEEIDEVSDTLKSGWLTTGPKTARFEKEFAEFLGTPHALAVNSGTAGLHLALEAIGVGAEDKVITSPYTFTASAEVIRYLGADPIFVDIDPRTFNLDPQKLESKLQSFDESCLSAVKAIIPVHFGGQACEMGAIMRLALDYDLKVIEDAAHALPCMSKGQMIGAVGHVTVFSFYVTKPLATGEGGMITTGSDELAGRMKIMRLHGISHDIWDRYTSTKPKWFYEVVAPGFKYNMTDIMAAMGIHQLRKVNQFQSRRQWIAEQYTRAFSDLPMRTPYVACPEDKHSWHLYVIQLELEKLQVTRDEFIEKMAEKGIGTSVHFIPLHIQPYWRDRYEFKPEDFPIALDCYRRAVSLPIYSKMTDDDVERVIKAVREILS